MDERNWLAEAYREERNVMAPLTEDAKWARLRSLLVRDAELRAECAALELQIAAWRSVVCPSLPKKHWAEVRRDGQPLDARIHRVRLENATLPLGAPRQDYMT